MISEIKTRAQKVDLSILQENNHERIKEYCRDLIHKLRHKEFMYIYEQRVPSAELGERDMIFAIFYGIAHMCDGNYIEARSIFIKSIASCREFQWPKLEYAARFQLVELLHLLEEFDTALFHLNVVHRDLKKYLSPDNIYNLLLSKYMLSYNLYGDISHLLKLEQLSDSDQKSASLAKKYYWLGLCYTRENMYNKAYQYFEYNLDIQLRDLSNLNNIIMAKLGMLSVIYNTSKPLDCINYFEKSLKGTIPEDGYCHTKLKLYFILYNCFSKLNKYEEAFHFQELYLELLSKRKDQKLDFKLIKTSEEDRLVNPLSSDSASNYFNIFSNGKDNVFLSDLIYNLTTHYNNIDLNVDFICSQMSMSRSKLFRKIKEYSNSSFCVMLNTIRIDASIALFKDQKLNLSEIAYRCGFNSNSYFSKCFREFHLISPTEYRNTYIVN